MIKGTKEIVTVRLSAKDLKNHREEVKDVMVKHKNHIMFFGVGKAKPRAKVTVVSKWQKTIADAARVLKDSYICFYNSNKDHKKAIEDGLKAEGIHYSKVYYSKVHSVERG